MIRTENLCNGCAECTGCGRNRNVHIFTCDCCGYTSDTLYEYDGKMYCGDCLAEEEFPQRELYEGETDTCDVCGREPHNNTLYLYDGQWLCLHCFLQQFDKVNQDE